MKKLKQQFAEMRKNTPKHIQWLLMVVAFVVVIILLILVLGNDDSKPQIVAKAPIEINIAPDMINWGDVVVGNSEKTTVKITASAPIKIVSVGTESDVNGFSVTDTCVGMGQINDELSCNVAMSFAPTAALGITQVPVNIQWHDADESDSMNKTSKIVVTLGATLPVVEQKPEPVVVPEPVKQPEPVAEPMVKSEQIKEPEIDEYEYEYEEPEPVTVSSTKQNIKRELESLAPSVKFQEEPVDNYVRPVETCSDFAFPAYGNSGKQIGWIKPSGGAYKYHPFSDTECNEPAGTYNPDNGIITDKSGKKIGTDAEHIGYSAISSGVLPQLSNAPAVKTVNRAVQLDTPSDSGGMLRGMDGGEDILKKRDEESEFRGTSGDDTAIVASQPYDRSFVLRQFKPIPATIVSDVRADADVYEKGKPLPVRATVDRNVYSDNGRNIIIPAGTLMLGYVTGNLPGPYKSIGRMEINWYQFIRPDGVEFNFNSEGSQPYSGDSQGRVGVPGRGSTDYIEQFFMPMITAMVPAAINLIAPISDAFVNQIDLDNNTVVQSGTMRSSELAKNEIITTWNQIAQKLMVDMMDNTVPPFTIAAGTRITVYSPEDLIVACTDESKKCYVEKYANRSRGQRRFDYNSVMDKVTVDRSGSDWVGQARSFNMTDYCEQDSKDLWRVKAECTGNQCGGYDYRSLKTFCESLNYQSKTQIQQDAYHQSEVKKYQDTYGTEGDRTEEQQAAYDEMIGITYDDEGYVVNPFDTPVADEVAPAEEVLTCLDGSMPDANGCCAGEIFTDMGEMGFNCCPEGGGDCFPPIVVNAE